MKQLLFCLLMLLSFNAYAKTPQRVIAVGGAINEMIFALNAQDLLVGNDTSSYYPEAASKLPKVGYQRTLSAEGVLSLKPDLIVLTNEAGPPAVIAQLEATGVNLLKLKEGRSVNDIMSNILILGKALQRNAEAERLVRNLHLDQAKLEAVVNSQEIRKKALFIFQHGNSAPMVAGKGTAADSIINLSGAQNVVTDYNGYKPLTPEAAIASDPEVILITKQGLEKAGGKEALLQSPGISLTTAARFGNVIAMDSLLMLGFGPRTTVAAMQLNKAYGAL